MERNALYPHITDTLAASHPEWVVWSDRLGWLPRVAGGADEGAPGDGGGDGQNDDSGGGDGQNDTDKNTGDAAKDDEQARIDAVVQKRLGQARKQWEKEAAAAADKAKMSEADRLKTEKDEAEKAAEERTKTADQRIIRAEAKVAAVTAGVKSDRVAAFLRVIDLDAVDLDDDGDPDSEAIKAAVTNTLDEFPEFKATGKTGASAGEHGDPPKTKPKNLADAVAAHYA